MSNFKKELKVVPTLAEATEPCVPGKNIPTLLYDLLHLGMPYKHEHVIVDKLMPKGYNKTVDEMGNVLYFIGNPNEHRTMFSCHLDTVHREPTLVYPRIDNKGMVWGATKDLEPCVLGADDKLGVFLMLHMMQKDIPGLYAFHVGEEGGGVGSKALAKARPALFKNIDRCIAFDRMNYDDVITNQRGSQCCSDEFAEALSAALNKHMPPKSQYAPSPNGTFTDSASYMHLIPECTNVSVAYWNQHSSREHFDLWFLLKMLLPAVLAIDWQALPTKRTAAAPKPKPKTVPGYYGNSSGWNSNNRGLVGTKWSSVYASTPYEKYPDVSLLDDFPASLSEEIKRKAIHRAILHNGYNQTVEEVYTLVEIARLADSLKDSIAEKNDELDQADGIIKAQNKLFFQYMEETATSREKALKVKVTGLEDTIKALRATIEEQEQEIMAYEQLAEVLATPLAARG